MKIIKEEKSVDKEKLKRIFQNIQSSNKIQENSTRIMSFVVDDLLDYAQLNAGKFRQDIKEFDLKEAIDEIV